MNTQNTLVLFSFSLFRKCLLSVYKMASRASTPDERDADSDNVSQASGNPTDSTPTVPVSQGQAISGGAAVPIPGFDFTALCNMMSEGFKVLQNLAGPSGTPSGMQMTPSTSGQANPLKRKLDPAAVLFEQENKKFVQLPVFLG